MGDGATALIGRQQELVLARSVLSTVRALVLGGEAGVGKTRLAQALADAWSGPVEWVSGAASVETIPFGAVVRLFPDTGGRVAATPTHELEVIRGAITAARAQPERLVVVDDCHRLDDLSALLIHQLVLDRSVPVLLTVRTGEDVPPSLQSLWADRHADRIDVLPLSAVESRQLTEHLVGGVVDDDTAEGLFDSSDGNPLLLGELVRDAIETGGLRQAGGTWTWDGRVPRGRHLRDAIRTRLSSIGDGGRRVVLLLALAEPLGWTLLQRLVPDVDLTAAERGGLIKARPDRDRLEVRLGHPLLGEVLLSETHDLDDLRCEMADAMRAVGCRRQGDLLVEAMLRLDAGDMRDPSLFTDAALRAIVLGATGPALRFTEIASAHGAGPVADLYRGEALVLEHRDDEAIATLRDVLPRLTQDDERVRAASALQNLYYSRDDADVAVAELNALTRELVESPIWRAVVDGNDIQYSMMRGRTGAATARAEALLAEHDDPRVRIRLVSSVGSGRALRGALDEAFAFVGEMLPVALAHQHELPLGPTWVMNAQAMALLLAGRLHDAENLIAMVAGMPAVAGSEQPWLHLFRGRIALARGATTAALEDLSTASAGFGPDDVGGFYRWARSLEAEVLALRGDHEQARAAAADAALTPSRFAIYDGESERARLWVDGLGGAVTRAIDGLLDLAARQCAEEQFALELHTLHDAVRLGGIADAGDRVLELADIVGGHWPPAFAAHVRALQLGSGADLEMAAEELTTIGADLYAAEALAEAARAHESSGLRVRAAAAARRRDELLAGCGPVRTPPLDDLVVRSELTRREREVAELAARGASNREIADRLFVSVRTAEGHLYRAMTKLGVTDRSELARVFA